MSEQMIDAVTFPEGARVLELGGGENRHRQATCMVDVRPGPLVDFPVDLNSTPLPIAPDDFDIIYAAFVLEHLPYANVVNLLKDCHRIVRPGGAVVFIVPNTEEQLRWIQKHPDGWDGKDFYTSASELLFGSQTYAANFHAAYFSADVAIKLFSEAGFEQIQTLRYGLVGTDLLVKARKAAVQSDVPAVVQPSPPSIVETVPAEQLYAKDYWNGGTKYGGYAHEGYRDFGCHEVTFRHIMQRKPESVLEIGAARGYVGKKLEDAGIPYCGLEVSKHCYMTRACDGVRLQNLTEGLWETPYNIGDALKWDLAFSIAVFEHIPESKLNHVLEQLKLNTKRGLHGIDTGHEDNAFDKTHVTLRPMAWWRQKFDAAGLQSHELVEKNSLEIGDYRNGLPEDYLRGDGKLKLHIGSHTSMVHWGWQNIDVGNLHEFAQQNGYAYVQHDVRKGLPVQTGTVDLIFHHHFLEHLTYAEGLSFLRECRRAIKRNGAMRIIVPNAKTLMQMYDEDRYPELERLSYFSEINDEVEKSPTDAMRLWSILIGGDHRAIYDHSTLAHQLNEAGWIPFAASFRKTQDNPASKQILRETVEMPFGEGDGISLFMDALPKLG